MLDRILNYFKEARTELRKTTWLSRGDVMQYTVVVIVVSLVLAVFLGGVDVLFSFILTRVLIR